MSQESVPTRAQILQDAERVVLKVGSRLLVDAQGRPDPARLSQLVEEIHRLRLQGRQVILVTSGAIAAGMAALGLDKRPKELPELQMCAAVGQGLLMGLYERECAARGFHCGQLLLTAEDVKHRRRHLNLSHCLETMLRTGVLPVINENDSITVKEIRFGENDGLAALVGILARAPLTVLLTSIDGMCQLLPDGSFGDRISVVPEVSPEILAMAGGTDGNQLSTGGMISKLRAAERCQTVGESLWIADGRDFSHLRRVFAGEDVGTLFPGSAEKMSAHKRWLAFFPEVAGTVIVDDGAFRAVNEQGRSLLPGGIRSLRGEFSKGDVVEISGPDGRVFARGIANYSRGELDRIRGARSAEIPALLGAQDYYEEAIHRDNLVLL